MQVNLQKNLKARRRVQAQRASAPAEDPEASEKEARKVREAQRERARESERGASGRGKRGCCWQPSDRPGVGGATRPFRASSLFFLLRFFFVFFSLFFSFPVVRALAPSKSSSFLSIAAVKRNERKHEKRQRQKEKRSLNGCRVATTFSPSLGHYSCAMKTV